MFRSRSLRFCMVLLVGGALFTLSRNVARSQFSAGSPPGFGGGTAPAGAPAPGPIPAMPGVPQPGGMAGTPGFSESQQAEMRFGLEARQLLQQYATEASGETKAMIKNQLRVTLKNQFKLQHQRRDDELKKIEKRLAELRTKLEKRAEAINTIVDRRLEQLVGDVEGLGWGADDIPQDLFDSGAGAPSAYIPPMGGAPAMMPPSNRFGGGVPMPTPAPATGLSGALAPIPGTAVELFPPPGLTPSAGAPAAGNPVPKTEIKEKIVPKSTPAATGLEGSLDFLPVPTPSTKDPDQV